MPRAPLVTDTAHMAELRAAQAGDVGAIVAIGPHSPGRPTEIQALVREQASLVAVEHGEILGFLAIRPGHFYQRDFIDLLLVAPRSRRQGIGRALMRAALQNASTPRMFVSTNESNTPMRELLRSEGWSPSGCSQGSTKTTLSTCSSMTPDALSITAPEITIYRWSNKRYSFTVCAPASGLVPCTTGCALHTEHGLETLAAADTIVVPGFLPLDDPGAQVRSALRQAARGARARPGWARAREYGTGLRRPRRTPGCTAGS
jgi:GNAT superfamily N-acetyltransferase